MIVIHWNRDKNWRERVIEIWWQVEKTFVIRCEHYSSPKFIDLGACWRSYHEVREHIICRFINVFFSFFPRLSYFSCLLFSSDKRKSITSINFHSQFLSCLHQPTPGACSSDYNGLNNNVHSFIQSNQSVSSFKVSLVYQSH